ncbi:anaerobic ribonucleoside triphosphate reductase, partial [Candidatus Thiomargarita nelsonii]
DFPWESPNTDLLFNMTARYGLPYFQGFIRSDLKPNMVRSMCLLPEETILFKNNEQIIKTTIGTLFAEYKDTQLDDEWWQCKSNVSALSLNPQSGKLEWVKINKFLRITDNRLVSICSKDGKLMRLSADHLVAILTRDGIETKKASDIKMDDFVLVIKDASHVLNQENVTDDVELAWFIGLNLSNEKIEWLRNSDFAAMPVASVNIENLSQPQAFYDIELEKNHYFVHSNGNISHNCCRLQLDLRELLKRGNGLFGSVESTGSLGVVTINCARLGYLYKGDETALYQHLDTLLELGKNSLEIKRQVIQQHMDNGLFP